MGISDELLIRAEAIPEKCASKHCGWCRATCDREDLSQVARIAIAKAAPSYEERRSFKSWAWRVAALAILDHHRGNERYRKALLRYAKRQGCKCNRFDSDPSKTVEANEQLLWAVEQLKGLDRAVTRRWLCDKASLEDIAFDCGLSVNEIWTRIVDAGRQIRHLLRDSAVS